MAITLRAGEILDARYRIESRLGRGGSASVYRARDLVLGVDVAVKVLALAGDAARDRFRSEFSLLAATRHPHLATVHDLGHDSRAGEPVDFYTAELVDGDALDQFAIGRTWNEVCRPLIDAVEALSWIHRVGLVHGDFKPTNVLVRRNGSGVLIDLGAADKIGARRDELSGTMGFVAPEAIAGRNPAASNDVFAVGRTIEVLARGLSEPLPRPAKELIARMTSAKRGERPSTDEIVEQLGSARAKTARSVPVPSEPPRLIGRTREVTRWRELLDAVLAGRADKRAVVVTGPSGIGKTRLYRELKWMAQLRLSVVEGSSAAHDPIAGLVGRALGTPAPEGVDALLEARDALARSQRPIVLALDDADSLGVRDRALLSALLRASTPADALIWLVVASTDFPPDVERLELGPLTERDAFEWIQSIAPGASSSRVFEATAGVPRLLSDLATQLASGRLRVTEVSRFRAAEVERVRLARAGELDANALRALAWLLVVGRRATFDETDRHAIDREALVELEREGFAHADPSGLRLSRAGEAEALLASVPKAVLVSVAREIQRVTHASRRRESRPESASALAALEVRAAALAGEYEQSIATAREARGLVEWAAAAWVGALQTLGARVSSSQSIAELARALELFGDPSAALGALAQALKEKRRDRALTAELWLRAASCSEKLGRPRRALRQLERASWSSAESELDAEIDLVRARSLMRTGDYSGAAESAQRGLSRTEVPRVVAELHEVAGLAWDYRADRVRAERHFEEALRRLPENAPPRSIVRVQSYLALSAYRSGDTRAAEQRFLAALEITEKAGLGDLMATAALNVGTACHQRGDWGRAEGHYQRGLRSAIAFGKAGTALTLRFNLAKLYADVGVHERVEASLPELARFAREHNAPELSAAVFGLSAEVLAARSEFAKAQEQIGLARTLHESRGARRELGECALASAEIAIEAGDLDLAGAEVERARQAIATSSAVDHELRYSVVAARVALARNDSEAALRHVERGDELAPKAAQLKLSASLESIAAQVYARRGALALSERRRIACLELWERVSSSLRDELADAFWRHPKRAALVRKPAPAERSAAPSDRNRVFRVFEINRRLTSTLDTEEILRIAIDSAIELTGAERGFLLLRPESDDKRMRPEVAIARNLDRERIGRSHLKFSQTVARRVLDEGEPILTVDALVDQRFSDNASVHAMKLRSIICVPIRAEGRVLGAFYLDNRFQRGRFGEDDLELISAFADQVAIAIRNGRLVNELERRTRALEAEQRRVGELMRNQEDEIGRLSHELELEREGREARGSYREIVGTSQGMQRVFALLDKVAQSDVGVLLTGESGTGKELVARAIHDNSARRGGPFVAVNCAALPEALLESELFGHARGAFTGAVRDHPGLFVAARGGTLFLDEIGETTLAIQAKLLRVLQEREVRPLGSERVERVDDVRVLSATNRRLGDEIAIGRFRDDLYYRLAVVEIELPPLRERSEDIPELAARILRRLVERHRFAELSLSRAALKKLVGYPWPGNVRQLENALARAAVLAEGSVIGADAIDLPLGVAPPRGRTRREFKEAEGDRLRSALNQYKWNVSAVSRALGIPRTTLYRKLEELGIR